MVKAALAKKTHNFLLRILATTTAYRPITTIPCRLQQPQLQDPPPLPSNPSTGSPLYQSNWRTPPVAGDGTLLSEALVPFLDTAASRRIQALSQTLDLPNLLDNLASWTTSQRWAEIKELFESWIRSLDKNGKPNRPNVDLYNHYLRAILMNRGTAGELLDLVARMDEYGISPNTASYNLVVKAMCQAREAEASEKLIDRGDIDAGISPFSVIMIFSLTSGCSKVQSGKDSLPDAETYDLVVGLLFLLNQFDSALKYLDLTLKSGYMVSIGVFTNCVRSCVNAGRLDTLASIIERCKAMDQNKALCPSWALCMYIADVAFQADHSKLVFYALEFFAKLIVRGENARPPLLLSVDEGLSVSALGTAARTHNANLLDASWAILRRSLRQRRSPSPEAYLAKIHAYASFGNLQRAFSTLKELENEHGSSENIGEDVFSPFTSLYPLVVACSKNGFATLDSVYFQLENLSKGDTPYKSVAALNCIILGCANIWDLDRAYQTFETISNTFGLTPDIHSYNALISAFGKLKKTFEASRVFEHLSSLGIKPNDTTYSLLVDAHLVNRDPKTALAVIDDMIIAGFMPSKETLKKVRRRSIRELDNESDQQVQSLYQQFKYRLGSENRREILFSLDYGTSCP